MKHILIRDWNDPPRYHIAECDAPMPGPEELLLKVHTVAVNFGDSLINSGRYQVRPPLPFVPGTECSGIVEAVGESVTGFAPGDHVSARGFIIKNGREEGLLGALAERIVCPPRNAVRVPKHIALEAVALFRSNNETSYYALKQGQLKPGETLLVLGAGGGTGHAAVQIGKLMGARVIASASSEAKRRIALEAGADIAIDSTDPDWRAKVREHSGGRGPDVVYDPVGGDATEPAFRSLTWGGRLLVIGFAAGRIPSIPANLALLKGISLVGVNLLHAMKVEPQRVAEEAEQLMRWFAEGKLSVPPVAARYPFERAGEAVAAVASGKPAGRVIVEVMPRTTLQGGAANE